MEKEQITGKLDELKGRGKQGIGKVSNDPDLEAEGVIDEAKGKLKQVYGDMKDAIKSTDKKAVSDVNDR